MSLAMLVGMAMPGRVAAQAPEPVPPPTPTLWNFLGIPQTCNKIKDKMKNRSGDCPCAERVDPLKRIADPANLKSPNPAIQAAAKIKQDQDLAPQKIKAIKYLAMVGCGCYPGVKEALVAALDDCTEEVRFEAAKALCQAAGNPCKRCSNSGCCNAAVMNKLQDVAFGLDEKGCFKESSQAVRSMAQSALSACQRMHPAGPPPVETTGTPGGHKIEEVAPIAPRPPERPFEPNQAPLSPDLPKPKARVPEKAPEHGAPAAQEPRESSVPVETPAEKPVVPPVPTPAQKPAPEKPGLPEQSSIQTNGKVKVASFQSPPGSVVLSIVMTQPRTSAAGGGSAASGEPGLIRVTSAVPVNTGTVLKANLVP